MKLSEYITKIEGEDKKKKISSIIALVYDNYRVIGSTSEIKVAVGNRKETTKVDLLNEEVAATYGASAYGNMPPSYVVYIEKKKAASQSPEPPAPPSGDKGDEGHQETEEELN